MAVLLAVYQKEEKPKVDKCLSYMSCIREIEEGIELSGDIQTLANTHEGIFISLFRVQDDQLDFPNRLYILMMPPIEPIEWGEKESFTPEYQKLLEDTIDYWTKKMPDRGKVETYAWIGGPRVLVLNGDTSAIHQMFFDSSRSKMKLVQEEPNGRV